MSDKELFKRYFKNRVVGSLALGLAIVTLSGCFNKDKDTKDNVNEALNDSGNQVDSIEGSKQSEYDGKILISDRLDGDYGHLEIPNENKHLGDVIDFARSPIDVSKYAVILHKDQPGASDAFRMLEIEDTDLSAFAIGMKPMDDRAYSVMILKPVDGKEDIIKSGLEKLKEDTSKLFSENSPDQSEVAKSAIIRDIGDYIVFVMCNDYIEVNESIENALNNQNELNNYIVENSDSFQVISERGVEQVVTKNSLDDTESTEVEDTSGVSAEVEEEYGTTEVGVIETSEHTAEAPIDILHENSVNDTLADWQ